LRFPVPGGVPFLRSNKLRNEQQQSPHLPSTMIWLLFLTSSKSTLVTRIDASSNTKFFFFVKNLSPKMFQFTSQGDLGIAAALFAAPLICGNGCASPCACGYAIVKLFVDPALFLRFAFSQRLVHCWYNYYNLKPRRDDGTDMFSVLCATADGHENRIQ
jgi:hypothetical protein